GAAVAITLVDVVVFVPVAVMGGIVGRVFLAFGITAAIATLFSLFMSFTLTPMLASWWFKRETAEDRARAAQHWTAPLYAAMDWPFRTLERLYRAFLPVTLRHPYIAVASGYIALILTTWVVVKSGRVPFEFMPSEDTSQVEILLEAVPGSRIEVMDRILQEIEAKLLDKKRYPEIRDLSATAGTQGAAFMGAGNTGGQYGVVNIILERKPIRRERGQRNDTQFIEDLRKELAGLPSVNVKVLSAGGRISGGTEADVEIWLQGPDYTALSRSAQELTQRLTTVPGVMYPQASAKPGRPEIQVRIDRVRAADVGMTAAQVAAVLRAAYEGDTSSQFREGGDEYDLRVLLTDADRNRLEDVRRLFLGLSPSGQKVHLDDVADVYLTRGPSRIERLDRNRCVTVTAYWGKGLRGSEGEALVRNAIQELVDAGRLAGISWRFAGQTERRTENFAYMFEALALAIVLVYVVTAALYSNILQPLNVMLTVPMAFGGGLLGLFLTKASISISSLIGMIMLMGLVGKNAILVVDYTNTLKARGKKTFEALLEAGPTRMRPIFMTTLATVMGLLPTALALNEASAFRRPMAVVVISGLILSTVLTLLIVPSFYMITDAIEQFYQNLSRRGAPQPRSTDSGEGDDT
ncbi:MAG: efflux RND transporter permease subunit, partial [Candidatus Zipacnadales bacterium]